MRAVFFCSLAFAVASTAQAGNESRFEAFALNADSFEIVAEFSENAIYWCGAAVYAQLQLGKTNSTRIWVLRGPAPSQTKPGAVAVSFGFARPDGASEAPRYTNDVDIVGNSLTLSQAQQGCTERSASG